MTARPDRQPSGNSDPPSAENTSVARPAPTTALAVLNKILTLVRPTSAEVSETDRASTGVQPGGSAISVASTAISTAE